MGEVVRFCGRPLICSLIIRQSDLQPKRSATFSRGHPPTKTRWRYYPTIMADASKQNYSGAQDGDKKGDMANALPKPVLESKSQSVREGWGSWTNFMGSYLLKGKQSYWRR